MQSGREEDRGGRTPQFTSAPAESKPSNIVQRGPSVDTQQYVKSDQSEKADNITSQLTEDMDYLKSGEAVTSIQPAPPQGIESKDIQAGANVTVQRDRDFFPEDNDNTITRDQMSEARTMAASYTPGVTMDPAGQSEQLKSSEYRSPAEDIQPAGTPDINIGNTGSTTPKPSDFDRESTTQTNSGQIKSDSGLETGMHREVHDNSLIEKTYKEDDVVNNDPDNDRKE